MFNNKFMMLYLKSKKWVSNSRKSGEYKSTFTEKPEEEAEIIIGKNRNGPTGIAHLIFQKAYTRFVNKGEVPIEVVYESAEIDAKHSHIEIPDL